MEHLDTPNKKRDVSPLLKLALEVGPLAVFFITNGKFGIFYATASFMAATLISLVTSRIFLKRIPVLALVTGVFVMVFGFLTIYLHDDTFIKIKPTIYYSLVAVILLFGLKTGRNLLKLALGGAYPGLSDRGWYLLTRNWIILFACMAVANEAIWRTTSTNFWAASKIWLFIPVTLIFIAANIPMLLRHGFNLDEAAEEPPIAPVE